MQLKTALVFTLSTVALAYPTNFSEPAVDNSNGTVLEKRGTYGWIASYASSDAKCTGGYDTTNDAPRPKVKDKCIWFVPREGVIGINWGTSAGGIAFDHHISGLNAYDNDNCAGDPFETIMAPSKKQLKGPQTCWRPNGKTRSIWSADAAPYKSKNMAKNAVTVPK